MIRFRFVLLFSMLLTDAQSADVTEFDFSVERIEAADWTIDRLDTRLEFSDSGILGDIRLGRLSLPAADLSFADSRIRCRKILLSRSQLRCAEATLEAELPGLGRVTVPATFDYERASGRTVFALQSLPVAGGQLTVRGQTDAVATEATFAGSSLQLSGLVALANALQLLDGAFDASGAIDINGSFRTAVDGTLQSKGTAVLQSASLSNELGTLVTDSLSGKLSVEASNDAAGWQFDIAFTAEQGEAYIEPVYANFAEHALQLLASGVRTRDFHSFVIDSFLIDQDSLLTLTGDAAVTLPGDTADNGTNSETNSDADNDANDVSVSGTFDIVDTSLEAIYASVLRIMAAGTVLGDLETDGRIAGRIVVLNNEPQSAVLELQDLILDDTKRRFALYGVNGKLVWPGPAGAPAETSPSLLTWESGNAYNIELGAAEINARLGGDDFELLQPMRVPTMGGALRVNKLVVNDYFSDATNGLLDAELEPVQLGQLSGAFGWPAFSGSLAGRLPLLQYKGNAMTVGGSLTATAFGGEIEVSGLRIGQPFGRVPRLDANISLRGLDLERLTNTFSFGLIQGTLSGEVTGLSMLGWRAAAMDLHLYTPERDRTPHRISQRAVENLASVGGGGAAAALSSGLLKFFEVFAYDRIALRCVLRDGICAMSGAGAAGDGPLGKGYYIVKGKGVPRIDVVGFRSKVSWDALVRQLANITRSEAPVVN